MGELDYEAGELDYGAGELDYCAGELDYDAGELDYDAGELNFNRARGNGTAAKSQLVYAELAVGTIMSPYNMALSYWFNPPVIHKIERQAGRIRVWASVDVMVTSVQVMILDEQGKVVGKGEAVKGKGDWWEYVPGAEGKVVLEARDLAGNVVREEMNI